MSAIGEFYRRQIGYNSILFSIHRGIEKRYIKNNISNEIAEAEKMQVSLRQLKLTIKNLNNSISQEEDLARYIQVETVKNLVQESTNIVNKIGKSNRSASTFFYRPSTQYKTSEGRMVQIFEEEIAALMASSLPGKIADKAKVAKNFIAGSNSVTVEGYIPDEKDVDQISGDVLEKYSDEQIKKYKHKVQHAYKSGKVDIDFSKVDKNFIMASSDINPFLQELLGLLAGKTFSLKNYQSLQWINQEQAAKRKILKEEILNRNRKTKQIQIAKGNQYRIGFGDTQLEKAILGELSEFFSDLSVRRIIYYRGYHYLAGTALPPHSSSQKMVETHWGHLKLIYEIKGTGLIDENGNPVAPVQYIILNDPNTENIYVKSANGLIQDLIKSEVSKIGGVKISASYFF